VKRDQFAGRDGQRPGKGRPSIQTFGLLAERVIGKVRLFINGEDLTNVRQTPTR
jgi:hypothetical protein